MPPTGILEAVPQLPNFWDVNGYVDIEETQGLN
jgi:hypothetical protein